MNAKPASISENLIEFRDVAYHINDIPTRMIVSDISLRIPRGETLVLLGRSGSGKTTLLKLINGMLLPPKGVVLVQNCATTEWNPIRLRRGIGYVIQEAGLFPHFTVAENVALVPTLENWDAPRTAARVQERSEEHTSELQSQSNLVCRLLLEKKKKKKTNQSDQIIKRLYLRQ